MWFLARTLGKFRTYLVITKPFEAVWNLIEAIVELIPVTEVAKAIHWNPLSGFKLLTVHDRVVVVMKNVSKYALFGSRMLTGEFTFALLTRSSCPGKAVPSIWHPTKTLAWLTLFKVNVRTLKVALFWSDGSMFNVKIGVAVPSLF
jgi:hypothetical protein